MFTSAYGTINRKMYLFESQAIMKNALKTLTKLAHMMQHLCNENVLKNTKNSKWIQITFHFKMWLYYFVCLWFNKVQLMHSLMKHFKSLNSSFKIVKIVQIMYWSILFLSFCKINTNTIKILKIIDFDSFCVIQKLWIFLIY